MPALTVRLFGPPRIETNGTAIEIGRRKALALMAYLVLTGQGYHRDALATLLWPASNQRRARGNLRHVLSELNRALGLSWLALKGETVSFKQEVEVWLDVAHFRHQLAACQTHGHSPADVCPVCLPLLTEAAALYQNDFLAGFTLRNSPEFDEWQFFQAESLRRELASALERLVRGHSARDQFEPAIGYARRWLRLDPLHEPAHRQLMQLYARSGQPSAALRQYQLCAQTLKDELGISPSEETTALYERIHSGDSGRRTREQGAKEDRSFSPLPPRSAAPQHNLPAPLTPFVGRETELAGINAHLQDPACRLLTLLGPGGIGKTRLALEAATAQLDHFTDGVYFVSLAPLQTVEAVVPAVAKALNFSFYDDENPQQQLLDYLRWKNLLLILDNFEHLLSPPQEGRKQAAEFVVELLRTAPDLKLLITSRAGLKVQGEQRFLLEGMDYPAEATLKNTARQPADASQDLAGYSAIRLFWQSARRVQPDFNLTTDNLTDVIRICRLAEGMPLAILLAAAWVELLTPAEIAAEIKQRFDFLAADWQDMPERQRSLRAVFDHSWRLLTKPEQAVFRGLSVFRGGFSLEAARAVTGASLRALMGLVDKSLVHRTAEGRYEMHDLLGHYAAEKLEASGEAGAIRDAHCAYYGELLYQRESDLEGDRQLEALEEIEADFENARTAWQWALERKNDAVIDRLLNSLSWFCAYRSRNADQAELFAQAWDQLAPGPAEDPPPVWGRILVAEFYARSRQVDSAQIEQGLAIAQKHNNRSLMAMGRRVLGEMALRAGHYAKARSLLEESIAHFRDLDNRFYTAAGLTDLAETYRLSGQPGEAIKCARQSLELSREIGDQFWAAQSLANTGLIALYTGNYAEAEGYLQEANAINREMGFRERIAESNVVLGKVAFLSGDFERANALAEEALEIAREIGNKRIARSARDLGWTVAVALGEETYDHSDEQTFGPITDLPPTIDRFQIKERLGSGSWSSVYRAHDPDSERDVALKVAHPEALSSIEGLAGTLNREAEIMTGLDHPAIPKCYGCGQTADHTYIVLEFIDGKTLEDRLEEQESFLPAKVVVDWAIQMCDALTYLHSQRPQRLILRDLKPNNVMVAPDGQVHLIDFGIVEPYRPGQELPLIGTAGYSPPEQYMGYSDARSDIYALGATLHQLLTRRDPRRENPFSFHKAPPRLLNPALSEALAAVIMKAVEFRADDRYQSAAELKAALLACR